MSPQPLQNEILKINAFLEGHEANWLCPGGLSRARAFFIGTSVVAELEARKIKKKTEAANPISQCQALQLFFS